MDKRILSSLIHLTVITLVFYSFMKFGMGDSNLGFIGLLNWDARWYYQIMEKGYIFRPFETCNLAFFPFFPYLWRITNLSSVGICIFNLILFLISFFQLTKHNEFSLIELLFFLGIPSLIFMALPYSEAIFFASVYLVINGYRQRHNYFVYVGLFFASLTRSASIIFVPAILLTELLTGRAEEKVHMRLKRLLLQIIFCVSGYVITGIIQYFQTGKWFYFIEIQKYWKRSWIVPKFPLTSYSPNQVLGVDALAFCIGLLAVAHIISWLYIFMTERNNAEKLAKIPPNWVVFSALYLAGTTVLDTCFTFHLGDSTSIWSINRHILATPFCFIYLVYLLKEFSSDQISKYVALTIIISCLFLTEVYLYPNLFLFYSGFFASLAIFKYFPQFKSAVVAFYLFTAYQQVDFFREFLLNRWIG